MSDDQIILRIGSREFQFGSRTYVMGIINVTPDSFSGEGLLRPGTAEGDVGASAASLAAQLVAEGADIIDVGGESTRPGASPVSLEEELRRVVPIIARLDRTVTVPISIDTSKAEVARQAIAVGAQLVNDVTALEGDPAMAAVVARSCVPVVLMHGGMSRNGPGLAQPTVVEAVTEYLRARMAVAVRAGIDSNRILLDPGFGFGKTVAGNLELLRRLAAFRALGRPLMLGPSRKGTIGKIVGVPVEERLEASVAAVTLAIAHGVDIVRVHDVKAVVQAVRMADAVVRGWAAG